MIENNKLQVLKLPERVEALSNVIYSFSSFLEQEYSPGDIKPIRKQIEIIK